MKRIIKNNYKIIIGIIIGITFSLTSVYAVDAYIESKKVSYDNKYTNKNNTQEAIDELYERSGIHQEKWIDPVLNGADPVLKDLLIPVEIKPNGDVYYANLNSEWYNYSEKRWANAIILIDNPSNTNYQVGDHILEDDIESYFVWIPRYQYKIWNLGNYSASMSLTELTNDKNKVSANTALWRIAGNSTRIIDIKFGTIDTISKMAESSAKEEEYYTHPAFTLGSKELNGIWVGKFETGGSASNIIIKPNVYSWYNEKVKIFFDTAKEYESNLDSHMMKNTEWGAVAYLSHSIYGIGNEVNINNANDFKTGYSAAANTNQITVTSEKGKSTDVEKTQPWNSATGYLASTTGNISGIYDMNGGVWEYMAACIEGTVGESGFDAQTLANEITNGYIDGYSKDSSKTSCNKRKLGDATGEMGPFYDYYESVGISYQHNSWYSDFSSFISSEYPWFHRGGDWNYGVVAGQFSFASYTGGEADTSGFRLVLSPN